MIVYYELIIKFKLNIFEEREYLFYFRSINRIVFIHRLVIQALVRFQSDYSIITAHMDPHNFFIIIFNNHGPCGPPQFC